MEMNGIIDDALSFTLPSVASLGGILGVSLDIAIIGGVFLSIFIYALFSKKKAMLASFYSLLFTGFIFSLFPYWDMIAPPFLEENPRNELYTKCALFVAIFLGIRFMIHRSIRGIYAGEKVKRWLDVFALSLVATALFFAYAYQFTVLSVLYPTSSYFAFFVTAPQALFWWTVGALVVVYLFTD